MLKLKTISGWVAAAMLTASIPVCAAQGSNGEDRMAPQTQNARPRALDKVGIDQNIGTQFPLDAKFTDENGRAVKLGDYFQTKRPVLVTLVYYDCTMLCDQVLNGLETAMGVLKFDAGKDYEVIAVSFDPQEQPADAMTKKKQFLARYHRPGAADGVHFLTGKQADINAIAQATGFHYTWDEVTRQWAHGSAVMMVTPQGKIAQYYYGIEYSPRDMQFGIMEASSEKLGTFTDKLILYCYHYDPNTGKYGALTMRIVRLSGALTVLLLGGFVYVSIKREGRMTRELARVEATLKEKGRQG
jgi:protein SCO1/2